MSKILVSPVAFNENVKITSVIDRFLKSPVYGTVDYCIFDDASTDGTSEIIQGYADKGVKTIRHRRRTGVGGVIKTAVQYALDHGYEVLVIMAGNDKDNPDQIPVLVNPITNDGYDIVQGSRYLNPAKDMGHMPFYRKIATRLHPLLMSIFTGRKLTDTTNGFRAMRLSVFRDSRLDWKQAWLDAYELEPYILFKSIVLGYKYTEAPVTKIYPPKKLGYTKMQPLIGWWSILKPVFYLGLRIRK